MPQQPLAPSSAPWVSSPISVAAVFLQVLTQSDQCGAQTGPVGGQDPPGQLEEDGGHASHAVVCGLQRDGSHLKGGVGEAHELREERV